MSASASSSSSSHVAGAKYDVFISFRGSDIRYGFLSHLKRELRRKQINVYVDEMLQSRDEISLALVKAIEGSTISLVVFSKDYAYSNWCLQELVKIMECHEVNKQIVIPVFYFVDPSDVRYQKGIYADAFARHEYKFKDDMEKLQLWRSVLNQTANLSGYHSSNFRNESEFIDKIIEDVLKKLQDKESIEPKRLVGFEENLASVESFMKVDSQEVQILGIWGMGGIENVREESRKTNGLASLLKIILSALLNEENIMKGGPSLVTKRRLPRKRVLLVLDDADTPNHLQYLIGDNLHLGLGSKVIITSRDRHVLISGGVHEIHEVKELNLEESLQLFCLHAFKQGLPKTGYEELSAQAIEYAKGIPLALKVLGSYLNSRKRRTWKSALKKFQQYPNAEIQDVLKVSYNGLDKVEKSIFLDIAFFFRGVQKDDIVRVLDASDFYTDCGIDNLLDKSLITISRDNVIEMHDLLLEMAKEIVREESTEQPERRSRLNDATEICDVLENSTGSDVIEGIILHLHQIKELHISADSFKKMGNLRFLKIYFSWANERYKVNLPFGLEALSSRLRYFCWEGYPLESLPLGFSPAKLVEIHMQYSQVKKLWDGVQDLANLKIIDMSSSYHLMEVPDFSMACNLEIVNLSSCFRLGSVHPSILSLHGLVSLDLSSCHEIKSFYSKNHLKSLKYLHLKCCGRLKEFLLSSNEMAVLNLQATDIETLNLPIGRFNKLEELYLGGALRSFQIKELRCLSSLKIFSLFHFRRGIDKMTLQILFDALRSLEELSLTDCELSEIPENICALSSLKILSLEGNSMKSLPTSIKHLSELKKIYLSRCNRLRSLPEFSPSITHFYVDECKSLKTTDFFRFRRTTLKLDHDKEEQWFFSCQNSVRLGSDKRDITEFTQFSLMRAMYNNFSDARVCYPGSTIPKWFRYTQTRKTSIAIELEPACSDQLLGLVCCCVLHPLDSPDGSSIYWKFQFEEDEINYGLGKVFPFLKKLNMDHVFLWYDPWERILKETRRRGYDQGTPSKFVSEFCTGDAFDPRTFSYDLIKASGICPIYASELHRMVQQMESELDKGTSTTTKRSHSFDDLLPNTIGAGVGGSFFENQDLQKFVRMMKQKHLRAMQFL
ncbi:disease resistance protein RPV1-like isoform X2 [Prosopis cineraria]|uniref:disease resistance protein RPV1-like isoform X2 n=1 Tax=Prosopis cineraria TaxID=364024 RepID=UPI0024108191|nr:disease resistance protein RPV1-like isoform X2 [Prosopis cineraria]